ncbi:DUF389 domain-containing protein [Natrononativus amylolyticus]|uniref:DUF389 domain-containing protein n=1 Tax=Natrononativus amylolyticus TaxID=2963434 RepID=UPI0020CFC1B7|nr:DUF389 domain-containing protein [Natrononativus amylolyticus]
MRLLQLYVDEDRREDVLESCESLGLECFLVDESGRQGGAIAYVPVPTGAVDGVLRELREQGLDEETYVGMVNMEGAIGVEADEISGRFAEGPRNRRGITHRELRAKVKDLKPGRVSYTAFAALAGAVATAGLLLNSAIVIVGAMVIAPFVGSLMAASVGAVVDDDEMFVDSLVTQVIGLSSAFVSALGVSLLVQYTGTVPPSIVVARIEQIGLFQTPNVLAITIAICAGAAGTLALAEDLSTAVAGVAVAAAIVPSVATSAIGLAWARPQIALGALVLLLVNVVAVNLTAYVGFYALGYRTALLDSVRDDLSLSIQTGAYAFVAGVFVVVVVLTVFATAQHLTFQNTAQAEIEAALEDPQYEELELVSVSSEYTSRGIFDDDQIVTVTVAKPADEEYHGLENDLRDRVVDETGEEVIVEVQFVDYLQSDGDRGEEAEVADGRVTLETTADGATASLVAVR